MRIINRQEFLKMSAGTVYCKYQPCYFGELCVKGDSIPSDFYTGELTCSPSVIANWVNSDDIFDMLDRYQKTGESFDLDLEGDGRDGLYDENQLFAIYEPKDIQQLIDKLTKLLPL
jgi:hypothetical protein